MEDKVAIILEHTRLAREFSELPTSARSIEDYESVKQRKQEIMSRIQELREIEQSWEEADRDHTERNACIGCY